jgi:hypothetical protein
VAIGAAGRKGSVMDLKEHQKMMSSELAKHPNVGDASGSPFSL